MDDFLTVDKKLHCIPVYPIFSSADGSVGKRQTQKVQERIQGQIPKEP